ncbi:MAG TPA: hypothetical protein VFO94_20430 [Gammaproteobacteria bacterium]|nr:hypothetical protein [Gammaproteobacteria bacterium]
MGFLEWLQTTRVATTVAETLWGYPTFETIHTMGMALLIGSLGLINLRVLGFKPELKIFDTRALLPLAWIGFTLNAISGSVLFVSDAVKFADCSTFLLKMALIALGGINAALLSHKIFHEPAPGAAAVVPTIGMKWIAGTSLVFWFGAIICGRLIAYTPSCMSL